MFPTAAVAEGVALVSPLVEPEVVACVEDEECTEEEAEVVLDVVAELDEVLVWTLELDEGEKDVFGAAAFVDEELGLDWSSPPKFHVPQMYPGSKDPAKNVNMPGVRSMPPYGQPTHYHAEEGKISYGFGSF